MLTLISRHFLAASSDFLVLALPDEVSVTGANLALTNCFFYTHAKVCKIVTVGTVRHDDATSCAARACVHDVSAWPTTMRALPARQGLSAAAGLFGSGLTLGLGMGMDSRHTSASSSADAQGADAALRMARIEKRCDDLERQCTKLERQVEDHKEVVRPTRDAVGHIVDAYVEWWYERNKKDVDVGIVELPVVGAVDLFPNAVEKQMYSQMFKAMVNQILDTELSVAGVKMRMEPVDLHKAFVPPVARPSARAREVASQEDESGARQRERQGARRRRGAQ